MTSNFAINNNKIILKNGGEFFGAVHDFEYNIGDKLYEFATMTYEDFNKLKVIYSQLIELTCYSKEADSMDEKMDCFFKMFQIVKACLNFSPYTHFYTQVLIDIIIKTYNSKTFRTDLLYKSQIGVHIENPYIIELLIDEWTRDIDSVSEETHKEYMEYFETVKDLLVENLIEKKMGLKKRLELIK